jgi:hypothetical protein
MTTQTDRTAISVCHVNDNHKKGAMFCQQMVILFIPQKITVVLVTWYIIMISVFNYT